MKIPTFKTQSELFDWLRQNKSMLIMEKKSVIKFADAVDCHRFSYDESKDVISKADVNPDAINMAAFPVTVVINTTNLLDSHGDVHVQGLWGKSLKEQKNLYLLQEHQMSFDHIISDQVKATARTMTWAELGYKYEGSTQALVFNARVEKDRNAYMAEQYAKDRVKNHSVGMRYVNISLALNSESKFDKEEKAVWDKYYPTIANKETADESGYFFAVTEAKIVEGSAVPLGSNFATPTISVGKSQPEAEPEKSTPSSPLFWLPQNK